MATPPPPGFSLLWTVGFAGKRKIAPARERIVRDALSRAMDFLFMKAMRQEALLTAVSSIARGGDFIFAELALGGDQRRRWHWKCVLPFSLERFLDIDLLGDDLTDAERNELRRRATACVRSSTTPPIVTSAGVDVDNRAQRDASYLDCGYRIVDEADVVIVLLSGPEMAGFDQPIDKRGSLTGAGSAAVARYAIAAMHPTILLDADAPDPWEARRIYNDPEAKPVREEFFCDDQVTPLVLRSLAKPVRPSAAPASGNQAPYTATMQSVAELQKALGATADTHHFSTVFSLAAILTMHLLATGIAALLALVIGEPEDVRRAFPIYAAWALWGIAALAAMKPSMVAFALWIEKRLHHHGSREIWTRARVFGELCRGALAMWPLPQQPLDAQDEEDFPKAKRVLRTLRLMREQDREATVSTKPLASETQDEADMRVACSGYIVNRLVDQIDYYLKKQQRAANQAWWWRVIFRAATGLAIGAGILLFAPKIHDAWIESKEVYNVVGGLAPFAAWLAALFSPVWEAWHHRIAAAKPSLEFLVIIAPFVAAYSLAMMSLLDCRRRERRYAEMVGFLERARETLSHTESNASRLRLIEQAERSLIEEQHEWFSVMRNLNV